MSLYPGGCRQSLWLSLYMNLDQKMSAYRIAIFTIAPLVPLKTPENASLVLSLPTFRVTATLLRSERPKLPSPTTRRW